MDKKVLMVFAIFLVIGFFLTGCSKDVEVSYENETEETIEETPVEEETSEEEVEEAVEEADDSEEVGDVVDIEDIDNRTKTITYDGENITLNIPSVQWVTKGDLELRERAVINDRENNIATAVGTVRNTGSSEESVIIVVRLYGKTIIDDETYHVLEVEGRKMIDVPGNSDKDFKFNIDYGDRVWHGFAYSFE